MYLTKKSEQINVQKYNTNLAGIKVETPGKIHLFNH